MMMKMRKERTMVQEEEPHSVLMAQPSRQESGHGAPCYNTFVRGLKKGSKESLSLPSSSCSPKKKEQKIKRSNTRTRC